MKKTMLAVAVTSLLASTAQAANVYDADGVSADVYGRLQFDIKDPGADDVTGEGSARLGVKLSSEVAPGLKAIALGEWQVDAENSTDNEFKTRHAYLGVADDSAGQLIFGQTDTVFYQAVAATDIYNSYGYAAFNGIEDGRQEGQVLYQGNFSGFYVSAGYQFSNDDFAVTMGGDSSVVLPSDTGLKLDEGYGVTLGYQFADIGLDVYAGYHVENLSADTGSADGTKTNLAASVAYTLDALYLAAVVVASDYSGDNLQLTDSDGNVSPLIDDAELFGYDLLVMYNIQPNLALYGSYAFQDSDGSISGDNADEFDFGVQYDLNSNAKVWAEYKLNELDGADDEWTIAAQYNF